jgi:hypothetical protein
MIRARPLTAAALAGLAMLLLGGCGIGATFYAAVQAVTGGGGGGSVVVTPITIAPPDVTRTTSTLVAVSFTVRGPADALALAYVEFAPPTGPNGSAGAYQPAFIVSASNGATLPGAPGAVLVTTSPGGNTYSVVWSLAATGVLGGRRTYVRVTPLGLDAAANPVVSAAAVERAGATPSPVFIGNDTPIVAIPALGLAERAGVVAIPYTLFDTAADVATITAEFAPEGRPFEQATTTVSQLSNLLTANPSDLAAPFPQTFVWDSFTDTGSRRFQGIVTFRLTPHDAFGSGAAVTATVRIDNNAPPTVAIVTPPRSVDGTLVA